MQKWFSALDDALIQRQWQAHPRGRWVACGAALCTWGLIATRPRRPAEPPGTPAVSAAGGRQAALAGGPQPAREGPGSASAPPPSQVPREDEDAATVSASAESH